VDLYLGTAREAWPGLPAVAGGTTVVELREAGSAVLAAVDQAVAAVCEGYADARRTAVRAEEAVRREFVDDLLTGTADLGLLVERAPMLGLRLEAEHVVLVVTGSRRFLDGRIMVRDLEAALLDRIKTGGDPDLLVATKHGLLVLVLPADHAVLPVVTGRLSQEVTLTWRLAVSRARPGAGGVRAGFEEARSALDLAARLGLPDQVVHAQDLLVYQVLGRDREPLRELVATVLLPLQRARGGAAPLVETLRVYFATGGVAVATAQQLHLSVRAVTYRLERVHILTGRDPGHPEDRYVLETALRGAQVLRWPEAPL
jgi:sugar diacid utilization regulator